MKITEDNVVQQVAEGNENALAFIIQTYGGLLNTVIRRYMYGNHQDFEECMDDVLLAIWQHIHSYDPQKNGFKQWVAAIAKFKAIDYQRKADRIRNRTVAAEIDDDLYPSSTQPSYEDDVEELLSGLGQKERAIFSKYYLEEVPLREIASQFQEKESWVHNKLSRGRKKLKKLVVLKNGG